MSSSLVVLPAPLPSTAITLGQLVTDPISNTSASLKPSRVPSSKQNTQSKYQDVIAFDENGRFTSTRSLSNLTGEALDTSSNILNLSAEQMIHTTLDRPTTFFNQLRRDTTTRSFLRKMTQHGTPVYFVTGLQTVRKPIFEREDAGQGFTETAPDSPHFRLPVRRVDSASNMAASQDASPQYDEYVLAVEMYKVKCRIGASNEPHTISDIEYSWSYHGLQEEDEEEEEEQLSIGLGKPLEARELKALAGMPLGEEESHERWGESSEEEEDDGIGGF